MRARGHNPGIVLVIAEPDLIPIVSFTGVDQISLAAASLRLQLVAQQFMLEAAEDGEDRDV